ncbi:hypothetical protein [Streptomyces tricolor]|uniref:hypothetical protein n=1 Tax=Streptomyces tricolor TaxID=68277 RepID=UPI0036E15FD8
MQRFPIAALAIVAVLASGGTAGAQGTADQPDGRRTAPRAEDYTWADGRHVVIPPGQTGSSEAQCPPGQVPTGGGYNAFDGGVIDLMVRTNSPTTDGWHAVARNTSSTNTIEFWAVAICAPGTQTQAPRPAPLAR